MRAGCAACLAMAVCCSAVLLGIPTAFATEVDPGIAAGSASEETVLVSDVSAILGSTQITELRVSGDTLAFTVTADEGQYVGAPLFARGSFRMRVVRAALYPSFDDVWRSEDLGLAQPGTIADDRPFLACDIELTNIDAVPTYEAGAGGSAAAFNLGFITLDRPVPRDSRGMPLPSINGGEPMASCNGGEIARTVGVGDPICLVSLEVGETRTVTVGFSVPETVESYALQVAWGSSGEMYLYGLDGMVAAAPVSEG